jgi:hypothetical protein
MLVANKHELRLDATPESVWQAITDFGSFPEWNPMTPTMAGELVVGAKLKGTVQVGPARVPVRVVLKTLRPAEELRWAGGIPGVMFADHRFVIEDLGDGASALRHHEEYSGIFTNGMVIKLANDSQKRFNAALKQRIEASRAHI